MDRPAPGCATSDTAMLACRPTATGTFSITVAANDSYPIGVSAQFTLTVDPRVEISTPLPDLPAADLGQSRVFTVNASFGTPPYTFTWSGLPGGLDCRETNTPSVSCQFSNTGNYTIAASVMDAGGANVTSGSIRYVVSALLVVTAVVESNFTPPDLGSTVTFQVIYTVATAGTRLPGPGFPPAARKGASTH